MKVIKLEPYSGEANTFAVTADGKNCILIDCAGEGLIERLSALNLTPKAVLLTHGHFDHVGGTAEFSASGVSIYCSAKEKDFIFSKENRSVFGGVYIPEFTAEGVLKEGNFSVADLNIKVIETPGHTAGSLCFMIENRLFTGDTLFRGSVGRCDLPTGNFTRLKDSLKKISALDGDFTLYCGHGAETTLERERKYNPYMQV